MRPMPRPLFALLLAGLAAVPGGASADTRRVDDATVARVADTPARTLLSDWIAGFDAARAGPAADAVVRFLFLDLAGEAWGVQVRDGRAQLVPDPRGTARGADATVLIDRYTWALVLTGENTSVETVEQGMATIRGDRDAARRFFGWFGRAADAR
ncbi:MAG: hypothetical protein MUF30_00185 [Burkholderiales bacterium]|jgi:alkyl sulfatase BDS1-like metallo-beta-lactamase superfamily hydrolase|nr:hypothetical protein [Burkholderiales bacterium]